MKSNPLIRYAFYVMSAFLMLCYIMPQMQVIIDTIKLAYLSLTFSIIFIFSSNGKQVWGVIRTILPYVILMFLVAVPFQFVRGFLYPSYLFWNSVFPALLCIEIIRRDELKWATGLVLLSLAAFAVVIYNTTSALMENDAIMRSLTSGNNDESFYVEMKLLGIGGYGTAYSSGMLTVFFATLALYGKKKGVKRLFILLTLALFLLFAWFSYIAQFTTLLIITLLSIGLSLCFYSDKPIWRFVLIVGGTTIYFALPFIIQLIIQDNIGNSIEAHLSELYSEYWGGGVYEEDIRAAYRSKCFSEILRSPIWGQDTTGQVHWIYSHSHSTLMSIFLATGIIGLYSYYKSLFKAYNLLITPYVFECKKIIFLPQIAYFLMLSFYNSTMGVELYWNLYLFIPLSMYLLGKRFIQNDCFKHKKTK